MTQKGDDVRKIAELNSLFLTLDERGQDSALTLLRSLRFAQSVMEPARTAPPRRKKRTP